MSTKVHQTPCYTCKVWCLPACCTPVSLIASLPCVSYYSPRALPAASAQDCTRMTEQTSAINHATAASAICQCKEARQANVGYQDAVRNIREPREGVETPTRRRTQQPVCVCHRMVGGDQLRAAHLHRAVEERLNHVFWCLPRSKLCNDKRRKVTSDCYKYWYGHTRGRRVNSSTATAFAARRL